MQLIRHIIIFLFFLNSYNVLAKPLPPGSGQGNVPANILFLLDSSASMNRSILTGDGIETPGDIVELSDGNIIIGQRELSNAGGSVINVRQNQGLVKILKDSKRIDLSFAGGSVSFTGATSDPNCGGKNSFIKEIENLGLSKNMKGYAGQDIIWATSKNGDTGGGKGNIVAVDSSGICVDAIPFSSRNFRPHNLVVQTIGGEDHLVVTGRWFASGGHKAFYYTRNLTTGHTKQCTRRGPGTNFYNYILNEHTRIALDPAGEYFYFAKGHIYGLQLEKQGNNYCPKSYTEKRTYKTDHDATSIPNMHNVSQIEVDPNDKNIIYITSYEDTKLQKLTIVSNNTLNSEVIRGTESQMNTKEDGDVKFFKPHGLHVSSSKVWVGDQKPSLQEFDKGSANLTWLNTYGVGKSRMAGAKIAINAIVSDSTLTTGANFGYGYWNAGVDGSHNGSEGSKKCPKRIDDGKPVCDYYQDWDSTKTHPVGTSTQCDIHSCLKVAVNPDGYLDIPAAVGETGTAFGTDAAAFAQLAYDYFKDPVVDIVDIDAECQLNYVIVIGDGAWNESNHDWAVDKIKDLRDEKKVKTLVVAYGDGIKTSHIDNRFRPIALAGSCDGVLGVDPECEDVIEAKTPQDLKTRLQDKITQILADRLAFTAPSITATIQEGGSLYQAQFNYIQHAEWTGTIYRKGLDKDGNVCHDADPTICPGNWDAAKKLSELGAASRKIWTVLPDKPYIGNWNNWIVGNNTEINELFEKTGNIVQDYHNPGSECAIADGSGNSDDIDGLIKFVRGYDYFAYEGCANINLERAHMLGDIYHSQLVEVGDPRANTNFTSTKQESYWRVKNNYQGFARDNSNRKKMVYAGANDGMLHAFNADTGTEEWAFIPPFIASKLPGIVNPGLDGINDGKGGTNAIFAVDGDPVVHDMFFKGLVADGSLESSESWHTILMITYGRGGPGFSVLDITNPDKPLHMYSVYNDIYSNNILVADKDGTIKSYGYTSGYLNLSDSLEARKADRNQTDAETEDLAAGADVTTKQEAIEDCQELTDVGNNFIINGTNACYKGKVFTFNASPTSTDVNDYPIIETNSEGDKVTTFPSSISDIGGNTVVTFSDDKTYNGGIGDGNPTSLMALSFSSCQSGLSDLEYRYDYTRLGETWSSPRIFRIPSLTETGHINTDVYVAAMGGGKSTGICNSGSSVFLVNLEDLAYPGSIYGSSVNKGPIKIADTEPPNGSNIENSITASPLLVTPDAIRGIDWRGAMLYINDLEGKITKINLSSYKHANLFDRKTLIKLNSTKENGRLSYHTMEATIGTDTKVLWLFGGTGNYERLDSPYLPNSDNILFGVKDANYHKFKFNEGFQIPPQADGSWLAKALLEAKNAPNVDDDPPCVNTTNVSPETCAPTSTHDGWLIQLEHDPAINRNQKVTSSPTVYKGNVYYPVYRPPAENAKCNLGEAFICSADDECGSNNSSEFAELLEDEKCYFVRQGVLSQLVIFGETLYGNIAGPSETEDTLVQILAGPGETSLRRSNWRQNF